MRLSGVLDANVIVGLTRGEVFEHLSLNYAPLLVPPAVVQEIVIQRAGRPGSQELGAALDRWITQVTPPEAALKQLPPTWAAADREVLALARSSGTDHLLTGDEQVRREAVRVGLTCLRATDPDAPVQATGTHPGRSPIAGPDAGARLCDQRGALPAGAGGGWRVDPQSSGHG